MRWIILTLLIPLTARAMDEAEFGAARTRLEENQKKTDALLKRAGVTTGFFTEAPTGDGQEKKLQPLFRLHSDLKMSRLKVGQLLFGTIINRLIVGAEGSPVLVELDEGQGGLSSVRLLGVAKQSGTDGRLAMDFQSLLTKTGQAIKVKATGLDSEGSYGLVAQVFSQKAWAVTGALASSFISGVAASQQTQSTNAFGFSQTAVTGRNAVLQSVAQTAGDQSKRLIDDATSEKPIMLVEEKTSVTILIQEEVRF